MRARCNVVATVAAVLLDQSASWACSCIGPRGVEILDGRPAAVFSGRVTKVVYLEPDEKGKEPPIDVSVEVYEVWRGPVRATIEVRTTYNKWTCGGYFFHEGEEYLVVAREILRDAISHDVQPPQVGGVGICNGTNSLKKAETDIKAFGPGQRPEVSKVKGGRPNKWMQLTRSAHGQAERGPRS